MTGIRKNVLGKMLKPTQLSKQEVDCNKCGLFGICNEAGLEDDIDLLEQVVSRHTRLAKNNELFTVGERFQSLYAVKSGFIATFSSDGQEIGKLTGLYFPGDIVGLGAIESGVHDSVAIALEDSSVCVLNYNNVDLLKERKSGFYVELVSVMSNRIMHERWFSTLISARSTEERLASFLVYVSSRLYVRDLQHIEFRLPVSRRNIADYLGIAVETVSRSFKKFQDSGLLLTSGRKVRINNLDGLMKVAELEADFFSPA